eukprot:Skav218655  [mRNA]  locus=scaffold365:774645:776402:- [translate_table: standard]
MCLNKFLHFEHVEPTVLLKLQNRGYPKDPADAATFDQLVPRSPAVKAAINDTYQQNSPDDDESKKQAPRGKKRREKLLGFLESHGFTDVNEPREPASSGCFFFNFSRKKKEMWRCGEDETIYPIHAAAQLGDAKLVRLLLAAGADSQQRRAASAACLRCQNASPMTSDPKDVQQNMLSDNLL